MQYKNHYFKTKIKKINRTIWYGGIVGCALFAFGATVDARTFNPNNIITDEELRDSDSLTKTAIQTFLERQNSVLARYSQVVDSVSKKASEIIAEVAQKNNINPKFLLTNLEKEQGLLSRSTATEKQLDWAMGFGCPDNAKCNEKYRGFFNQVESAAITQNSYIQKASQFSFQVGRTTVTKDKYAVTPANQATANLYIYTPHVGNAPELGISQPYGANKLFWRIWQRYFTYQPFLDGQVLTNGSDYWVISNNTKRKFASADLFLQDYRREDAIAVSTDTLLAYSEGVQVKFANNSVVRSSSSGQMYLLVGNERRPLADGSALAVLNGVRIATTENDVRTVDESDLAPYLLGGTISSSSQYPQGKLFRDESGAIWLVKDGLKSPVDSAVVQNRFAGQTPEAISSSALEVYPTASGIKLKDGTFVTSGGQYYLISNGERMRIDDLGVFNRVFGPQKQSSALSISTTLLQLHPAGEPISYIDDTVVDPILPPSPTTPTPTPSPADESAYSAALQAFQPDSLVMMAGETKKVTVLIKNTGSVTWTKDAVYLSMRDSGKTTSLFTVAPQVSFTQASVAPGEVAQFTFDIGAPVAKGLMGQRFIVSRPDGRELVHVGKFIDIKPGGATAQLVSETIPDSIVQSKKGLVSVIVKIKNTGKETWLSRRTALEAYNEDGTSSVFYDIKDWVRKEVVGVPINKSTIKPGETGEFRFTLDARKLKKDTYTLNFKLNLLDKGKQSLINDKAAWIATVKVE